ncbi:UNKNOWN [Stylonychia lemnae]|uniref:Uncharacterized protein n=1 Tax=Stylonychia lemnae TaxID=5949 RepID=A0A078AWW0_STYLE|nr:UNKNOWN [Stylonychia lemnae]|eukprot:CDW86654.1 UNKNOWN [Stylonychia lemnae]
MLSNHNLIDKIKALFKFKISIIKKNISGQLHILQKNKITKPRNKSELKKLHSHNPYPIKQPANLYSDSDNSESDQSADDYFGSQQSQNQLNLYNNESDQEEDEEAEEDDHSEQEDHYQNGDQYSQSDDENDNSYYGGGNYDSSNDDSY